LEDYTKSSVLTLTLHPYAKSTETSAELEVRLETALGEYTKSTVLEGSLQPYAKSADTSAALISALNDYAK
jgi:hypothetical protein